MMQTIMQTMMQTMMQTKNNDVGGTTAPRINQRVPGGKNGRQDSDGYVRRHGKAD
jgi:hypothetical protein